MSMPIFKGALHLGFAAVLSIFMTACSDSPVAEGQGDTVASDSSAPAGDTIPCALNGATEMTAVCKHSVIGSGDAAQLLLEGPEGDFRRFTILTDGRGLEPADGAETAAIKLLDGGKIEVSVGDDIFVLPAKVKPSVAAALPQEGEKDAAPATAPVEPAPATAAPQ